MRVRIDQDRLNHTPSILFATESRSFSRASVDLIGLGGQYVAQLEWSNGFGVQLGAAVAHLTVSGSLFGVEAEASGVILGGQARAYYMVWSGGGSGRPHALTAFVNLRGLYYTSTGTDRRLERAELSLFSLTAGAGLMAELSLLPWLSVCPYAWLTPGLTSRAEYQVGDLRNRDEGRPNLKTPLLFGLDVWLYPFPSTSEGHLSLSVLASLIDADSTGNRMVSGVIGYTF